MAHARRKLIFSCESPRARPGQTRSRRFDHREARRFRSDPSSCRGFFGGSAPPGYRSTGSRRSVRHGRRPDTGGSGGRQRRWYPRTSACGRCHGNPADLPLFCAPVLCDRTRYRMRTSTLSGGFTVETSSFCSAVCPSLVFTKMTQVPGPKWHFDQSAEIERGLPQLLRRLSILPNAGCLRTCRATEAVLPA